MSEHGLQRWRKQLVFPILHKFAFRTGLLFGFGAMLALVVFVTYIGLRNLESIYRHTQFIVDNHVAKITLVTTMSSLAHDRIAIMQKMTLIDDPFDRDELTMYLDELASRFVMARTALMEMSLTSHEKLLLSEQGQRTDSSYYLHDF